MEYLTVGTSEIKRDLFVPIKDGDEPSIKPTGGIWLTKYDSQYENYNEWVDYLIDNPDVLFYKSLAYDIWKQPCSLVKLNDDSKIFSLENTDGFEYLINTFKKDSDYFSYEIMSQHYDGIYIDILKMMRNDKYKKQFQLARELCVSSLILFNLDCIDYYQSGHVLITPFDLEYGAYETPNYEIICKKTRKRVR